MSKACNLEACFLDDRTFIKLRRKNTFALEYIRHFVVLIEIQVFFLTFE